MTARPWMPLYVAEYLADTAHLSAAESGAYLHLIMHYWLNEGLPTDDRLLARIARLTPTQWKSARPIIENFFDDGWKHGRIEFELTEAARISAAGRVGGRASGEARRRTTNQTKTERPANDRSNDPPTKPEALHLPSQTQREERKKDPAGAASELFESGNGPNQLATDEKTQFYARAVAVLGKGGGGLATNLLKAKNGNVALARAVLETASTKGQLAKNYVIGASKGQSPTEQFVDPRL